MTLRRLRKLFLTMHVSSSVGWFGSVIGFLALSIAGLTSKNDQTVRAAYLGMDLIGWYVIVPLGFFSLLTGLVQSLGTEWGLFRHYWVVAKFLITLGATILLLVHMQPTSRIAGVAAATALSSTDLRAARIQLVGDAGAALLALLVNTTLSVYKPRGLTPYGRRKQPGGLTPTERESTAQVPSWVYVFAIVALVVLFVLRHITMGGFGHHAP